MGAVGPGHDCNDADHDGHCEAVREAFSRRPHQVGYSFANPAEWRERGNNPAGRHERHRVAVHRRHFLVRPAFPGLFFFGHVSHPMRKTCY